MKRLTILLLLCLTLALTVSACGGPAAGTNPPAPVTGAPETAAPKADPTEPPAEPTLVSYSYEDAGVSLLIPEGWDWAVEEHSEESYTFGIRFWPAEEPEGSINLYYFTHGFGVCGTGLKSEPITFESGLTGSKGTYDRHRVWDFISFETEQRGYAALTQGDVAGWWRRFGKEAMSILDTAKFGPTQASEQE